jgi:hypothetical protein
MIGNVLFPVVLSIAARDVSEKSVEQMRDLEAEVPKLAPPIVCDFILSCPPHTLPSSPFSPHMQVLRTSNAPALDVDISDLPSLRVPLAISC